jgi:hypothetical protein
LGSAANLAAYHRLPQVMLMTTFHPDLPLSRCNLPFSFELDFFHHSSVFGPAINIKRGRKWTWELSPGRTVFCSGSEVAGCVWSGGIHLSRDWAHGRALFGSVQGHGLYAVHESVPGVAACAFRGG